MRFLSLAAIFFTLLLAPCAHAADGEQQFANLGTCKLISGQQIEHCKLGYRTWGRLNAEHSNAVLFPTWFSGTSEPIGDAVGASKLVDPAKYFVIAVDAIGDGVSSSPSNSETQHATAFPAFTIQDMVNAEYRLATETLRIPHLHAVMGISMGGIQTFEWIVDYPGMMDAAIPIVGSTRLTSADLLLLRTEAETLKTDPAWQNGHYTQPPPMGIVAAIHQMNLTTPAHYAAHEPLDKFATDYEGYLRKGILPFDANDWLWQLGAILGHDVAHGGRMEDAAKKIKARVLVVNAAQDHMVNPKPALDFAALIGAKTIVLTSNCGHLSPGCEAGTLDPAVRSFLNGQ